MTSRRSRARRAARLTAAVAVTATLGFHNHHARAKTWDNSSGNALYKTAVNWDDDLSPPTQSSAVIFPAGFPGGATTVSANVGFAEAGSITFNANYTLTGSSDIVLGTGTVSVSGAVTATLTNATFGNAGFHKAGTGELIVGGGLTSYFTGASSIDAGVLNVTGGGPLSSSAWTIGNANLRVRTSSSISNSINFSAGASLIEPLSGVSTTLSGVIGGGGTLNKIGAGTLTLTNAANTYVSGTNITAGTLRVGADGNLGGATGGVTFFGGILNTTANFSSARSMFISNSTSGALFNVDSGTTFTTTGVIGGISGAGMTKSGTGTMVLGGASANTHSGLTTVSQGTLRLAKTAGNAIANNVSIGDGNGAATLILGANEQIVSGNVNVFSPTSTFDLNGFTETIGTVTMSTGNIVGNGGTLVLGGGTSSGITTFAGTASSLVTTNINLGNDPNNRVFNIQNGTATDDIIVDGVISNGSYLKNNAGAMIVTGASANTHTGTSVTAGILSLRKNGPGIVAAPGVTSVGSQGAATLRILENEQIGDSAALNVLALGTFQMFGFTETVGSLNMTNGTITSTAGGTLILNGNVTTNANATVSTIGATVNLNAATRTFTVADGTAASDLTVTAAIENGNLIKAGPGLLTLSGASTRTGTTTINAGTLAIGADNHLGATGVGAGALTIDGGTLSETAGFDLARPVAIGPAGGVVDNTIFVTFSGSITGAAGSGTLAKRGTGEMDNKGTVSLAGPLSIERGTYRQVAGSTTVGAGATFSRLTVGSVAGQMGRMEMLGGTVTADEVRIGEPGNAEFFHNNGTFTISGGVNPLWLASTVGSSAYYILGNGTLNVVNNTVGANGEAVGFNGSATFNQQGGTHTVGGTNGNLVIGYAPTGVGTYVMQGGTLTCNSLYLGRDSGAQGTFTQTGGTVNVVTEFLDLGLNVGATGIYNANGGSMTAQRFYVGGTSVAGNGVGILNVAGGVATTPGECRVWDTAGGTAINLSAGTLSVGSLRTSGNPSRFAWSGGTLEFTSESPAIGAGADLGTSITLSSGKTLRVTGTSKTIHVKAGASVSFGGGKADLTDKKMIVVGGNVGVASGGAYNGLSAHIQSAQNGGAWDGAGITTSKPDAVAGLTSIGIGMAGDLGYDGSTFGGVIVSANTALIMYTYAGDANLDGLISGDDYAAIDLNASVPGASGWINGDFNWDGIISGDDYAAIDLNIVAQGAPFPMSAVAGVVAVPEPALGVMVALAALRRRGPRPSRGRRVAS